MKYIIPVIIGVGLFVFLYKNVDIDSVGDVMRNQINYFWIAVTLMICILSHIFRALRWRLQLRALGVRAPISALINSIFGTYAVNLIFPRLGEVWRTTYIASRQKASFTTVFGSMLGDRLSDTLTVVCIMMLAVVLSYDEIAQFIDTYPEMKMRIVGALESPVMWGIIVAIVAALMVLARNRSENIVLRKIKTALQNLWNGISVIVKMKKRWSFLLYTVLIWGCYYMQLYVGTFAFPFTMHLSAKAILVLFIISSVSMGIPTNGGLGAWHIAMIFGLSLYGIGGHFDPAGPFDAEASAFAMVIWGTQAALLVVLGIYAFVYMEIDRRRIASGKEDVDASGAGMTL